MIANAEQTGTTQVAETPEAKATKKARAGAQRAHVAHAKAKSGKKASPAKKAPKGRKKAEERAKTAKPAARQGSKTQQVLDLLKRPGGATLKAIMADTGWQAHSVRGFISGTLGKKMSLDVVSAKGEDGERTYSLKG